MRLASNPGIMLVMLTLIHVATSIAHAHFRGHGPHGLLKLAGRAQATFTSSSASVVTATPCTGADCAGAMPQSTTLPCNDINGTKIVSPSGASTWDMLCNIDFYAQNIYPFVLAGSFENCLQYCEKHNNETASSTCAGFVWAPDRIHDDNDCYLKSSVNDMVYPSTIHLIGATLVSQGSTAPTSTVSTRPAASSSTVVYGGTAAEVKPVAPSIASVIVLGASSHISTQQYVEHPLSLPINLASTLLTPEIDLDLINNYSLAADTGSWTSNSILPDLELSNLSLQPRMSRDGGKGGTINGTHIYLFCDTATYGDTETYMGYMNGFVSSSATVDLYRNAIDDKALLYEDPLGQWQDDVGRLRGWIEMTQGEQAFNIQLSGQGFRYAVWPESSLIPLNVTHALIYAALVFVEVDMTTQNATFTNLGNTLITVHNDDTYGPHADRLVSQMFTGDEVEWGSLGGLRGWGISGNGTNDGSIYLFGKVTGGVSVAKVTPDNITDRSAYSYWNGSYWSADMPGRSSTAHLIEQPVQDFDVFFSPFHGYFFMVYLTPYADNTFWYSWLKTTDGSSIIPSYETGGEEDYCEHILHDKWSDPMVLYKAPSPEIGFIYAGGVHAGYFGADDITEGGLNMLITWTEHTSVDPNDPASGYAHKSLKVTFHA